MYCMYSFWLVEWLCMWSKMILLFNLFIIYNKFSEYQQLNEKNLNLEDLVILNMEDLLQKNSEYHQLRKYFLNFAILK